ncbi:unnamed protein product [Linum tenue]|uniref:DUF674 domain-containing protein n=1 Tax=Linum tenue TaxID=586396 RepID=A0AAV0RYT0_9ROSI|nr:unnamed protein product [Linum tenue]
MATRKVTLKLLINKKTKKVLFAEAGKDFVDFLFTLLSFPLGTVIKLLSKNKMVGCLGNLYESIEELSDTFFQPNLGKATVLNPKLPSRPSEGGFVKGVITYMVMDNLEVKPMSTISSITMLNKFNIQEVGALEEKVIELGVDEVAHLSVFWTEVRS